MTNIKLPPIEQQVLDDLVPKYGVDPELVDRLLRLVMHDYRELSVYGHKAALKRDIAEQIERSLERSTLTDASGDDGP